MLENESTNQKASSSELTYLQGAADAEEEDAADDEASDGANADRNRQQHSLHCGLWMNL